MAETKGAAAPKAAVKKAAAAKKAPATKAAVAKKAPAKAVRARKATVAKGDGFECEVCGLMMVVDEECGCVEAHEIICCSQPMKQKKARAKAAK